jgi:hypothetical protein
MVATTIYALLDPRDESVRYVGATRKRLSQRLRHHEQSRHAAHNTAPRYEWLRDLAAAGLRPRIQELEVVPELRKAEAEQRWIEHYRGLGSDLLNVKRGGGGPSSSAVRQRWTPEQRAHASATKTRLIRDDPGIRERIAAGTREGMAEFFAANREEFSEKVSAGLRRRYEDPEQRRKTGEASRQSWESDEMRERHSASMRAAVAREQRVKCPSCDMVSRPANIARHRRARGH